MADYYRRQITIDGRLLSTADYYRRQIIIDNKYLNCLLFDLLIGNFVIYCLIYCSIYFLINWLFIDW